MLIYKGYSSLDDTYVLFSSLGYGHETVNYTHTIEEFCTVWKSDFQQIRGCCRVENVLTTFGRDYKLFCIANLMDLIYDDILDVLVGDIAIAFPFTLLSF